MCFFATPHGINGIGIEQFDKVVLVFFVLVVGNDQFSTHDAPTTVKCGGIISKSVEI